GQHVLEGASGGDDLLAGGPEAHAPQLAHEVVLAVAGGGWPRRHAEGDRPRRGLIAHPDAAVEVQEEDVVGLEARRDGHVSAPIILAAVRPTLLALCAVLLLAACGGGDAKPASTAAAPAAARVTCKKVAAPA